MPHGRNIHAGKGAFPARIQVGSLQGIIDNQIFCHAFVCCLNQDPISIFPVRVYCVRVGIYPAVCPDRLADARLDAVYDTGRYFAEGKLRVFGSSFSVFINVLQNKVPVSVLRKVLIIRGDSSMPDIEATAPYRRQVATLVDRVVIARAVKDDIFIGRYGIKLNTEAGVP